METAVEQISAYRENGPAFQERIDGFKRRLFAGIKWWAEHQAWPATDEIRVDRNPSTCG